MVIGRHEPKQAHGTTLNTAIAIGLDESLTALEECFSSLTNEQFWHHPLPRRHCVATLVEHCVQCLDLYACEVQGAELTFEPEERFAINLYPLEQLRPRLTDLPTVAQMREKLCGLREAVMRVLNDTADAELHTPRPCWWFEENPDRTSADAYMRCIWHTMAHVRQIWHMRGMMGLTDEHGWPQQHWA